MGFHCFPFSQDQSWIWLFSVSESGICSLFLSSCYCCVGAPFFCVLCIFPTSVWTLVSTSQGFLLIPSVILIYFLQIKSIAFHYPHTRIQKHAHRHRPAPYLAEDIKVDDLIACSRGCHLFSFARREKTTGQIPALQTALREKEEEGGQRGLWWSRAKGQFFYRGSAQWSCIWRWGVQSKSEVTTEMTFHLYIFVIHNEWYITKQSLSFCHCIIAHKNCNHRFYWSPQEVTHIW